MHCKLAFALKMYGYSVKTHSEMHSTSMYWWYSNQQFDTFVILTFWKTFKKEVAWHCIMQLLRTSTSHIWAACFVKMWHLMMLIWWSKIVSSVGIVLLICLRLSMCFSCVLWTKSDLCNINCLQLLTCCSYYLVLLCCACYHLQLHTCKLCNYTMPWKININKAVLL